MRLLGVFAITAALLVSSSCTMKIRAVAKLAQGTPVPTSTPDTTAPVVSLISPAGGDTILGGAPHSITWTATDPNFGATPISLEISSDGGSTWSTLVASTANSGSYPWNVPSVDSSTYRIRLTAADLSGNQTVVSSASNFTIVSSAPVLASLTITNAAYTNNTTLGLTWGALSGNPATEYCIQLNDTNVANCSWQTYPSFPASIAGGSDGAKTAYAWVKGSTGVPSVMVTSNSVTLDTVRPTLTTAQVLNVSPSASRVYLLSYTGLSESISEYCINENDTAVANCAWVTASSLPTSYTVSATQTAKVLSVWVRDLAGNQQLTRTDSNSVTYSNTLVISSTNVTSAHTYSYEVVEGKRLGARAVTLAGGKVLITGGCSETSGKRYFSQAKTYDPATNKWAPVLPMMFARCYHTMVLLADGRVMVAGGMNASNTATDTVEIYNPTTQKWYRQANMGSTRAYHTATVLPSGKVFIAGGHSGAAASTRNTTEIFDPAANVWLSGPNMNSSRFHHAAALTPAGKVILMGGRNNGTYQGTVDEFTPAGHTGTMAAKTAMSTARVELQAFSLTSAESGGLTSGAILAIGGRSASGTYLSSVEMYDVANNTWTTKAAMSAARAQFAAEKFSNGQIFIFGGRDGSGAVTATQLYLPSTNAYTAGPAMSSGRTFPTSALLADDDRVLLAYGESTNADATMQQHDTGFGFTFRRTTNSWVQIPNLFYTYDQQNGISIPLSGSRAMTCFGRDAYYTGVENTFCAVYDPAYNSVWYTSSAGESRGITSSGIQLADGRVLIVGTETTIGASNYGLIYDFATDSWSHTSLRARHINGARTALLPGNRVLVIGLETGTAYNNTATDKRAYIYDVAGDSWSSTPDLPTAQSGASLYATSGGRIFVVGGYSGSTIRNTTYEYDVANNLWITRPTLPTAVMAPVFGVALPNADSGSLKAYGGCTVNDCSASSSVIQSYDLATNTWSTVTPVGSPPTYVSWDIANYNIGFLPGEAAFFTQAQYSTNYNRLGVDGSFGNAVTVNVNGLNSMLMYVPLSDGGLFSYGKSNNGTEEVAGVLHPWTYVRYLVSGGDGDYTFSRQSGTYGNFYPNIGSIFPDADQNVTGTTTIQVQDGSGQTATAIFTR